MIDTRIVSRLRTIESLAVIPRVASTNLIARRIVTECIENELSLPQAMIIAREQFAGRGRNDRSWSSPAGKGIYATTLLSRPLRELPLVPLAIANIVATYLRDTFAIDARIKWPNDILVGGRKIAGILIEARVQDERVYLLVGTGVNVEPVTDDERPNAVAISEVSPRNFGGIETATVAFVEHIDEQLSHPLEHDEVLA
ncbi:MAG: biotin--[acetyl-CoA-carboxylase] ligase, partial [Thermoanaerobaculia bacterium]